MSDQRQEGVEHTQRAVVRHSSSMLFYYTAIMYDTIRRNDTRMLIHACMHTHIQIYIDMRIYRRIYVYFILHYTTLYYIAVRYITYHFVLCYIKSFCSLVYDII